MKLSVKIILSLIVGAVIGLFMNLFTGDFFPYFDQYLFSPLGTIFLNLIKMLVVPLVFFSLVMGVAGLGDPKKLGRIGLKTISYFLTTTALAISLAIALAVIFQPGKFGSFDLASVEYEAKKAPDFMETLINMIPTNPIQAFANGDMLQIIIFSAFIGIALSALGTKVKGVTKLFEQGNDIMMYLVNLVMKFAPFGTFGLIASAVGKQGFDAMKAMGIYMIIIVLALFLHLFTVYGGTIFFLAKRNPIEFFKEMFPAMSVGFSTSSSSAALPVSMDIAQNKLGVPKSISSFVQPLGATINMDGTAIMQGVATIFIAQVYGADLTFAQIVTVVVTAVLASVGTASVPGAGLIMLAMVLQSVNLPVEGIALIIGVDRLLDMTRTAINLTGDAACAVYVAETEKTREEKEKARQMKDDSFCEEDSVSV